MDMQNLPQFIDLEQVSDGWIKKYILTYRKPDGSLYTYESTSRKSIEAYREELKNNAYRTAVLETKDSTIAPDSKTSSTSSVSVDSKLSTSSIAPVVSSAISTQPTQLACDAVCMVPELDDGSLLLIKEFRYPLNGVCVAFPAGLIDPGENIEDAIDRELREETGYCVRRSAEQPIRLLPQAGFSSTGMSDESVQVAFVQVEKAGNATPEPSEFIEPFILQGKDIRSFIDSNTNLVGTRTQLILELLAQRYDD